MKYSVIIPIFNEEDSIIPLYNSINEVMSRIGGQYEIIFVNDGSNDKTFETLSIMGLKETNLIIVNLEKNSGQAPALQVGFDKAKGELIITIDGDMQYDPNDIPRLLNKLAEGYDAVCGWRYERMDSRIKKISAKVAVTVRRLITAEKFHDPGCALTVFKKDVLKNIYLSKGMHVFFSFILLKFGYSVAEIKVKHYPRRFGKSKYNIHNRLFQGIINLARLCIFDLK